MPTATYPMFPERLAMEGMSLQQGKLCNAVSVSVVLRSDGRLVINENYTEKFVVRDSIYSGV